MNLGSELCTPSEPVCGSYLLFGEYDMISPVPSFINNFTDATVVVAHELSGVQVDIVGLNSGEVGANDCKIFGMNGSAVQICLCASPSNPNALIASHFLQETC